VTTDPLLEPPVDLLRAAGEGLTAPEIERGARTIAEEHGVDWDSIGGQYGPAERDQYRAEACAVMVEDRAALLAAGRLLPGPLETRTEWGVRTAADDYHVDTCDDAGGWARRDVRILRERGTEACLIRREVRTYQDGSTWTGSWVPVDPDTNQQPP
jgi:hypothetical protein